MIKYVGETNMIGNKIKVISIIFATFLTITATSPLSMQTTLAEGGEILWTYDADLSIKHIRTADLNGDTIEDIISAEYDSDQYDSISKVYGIDGVDGTTLWTYVLNDGARSMTIGDINNDGVMDAVVGASKGSTTPDGRVHAIDGTDGSQIWVFTPGTNGDTIGDVAVGNFNGDVYPDVAVACWDDFVYAINGADGTELWNYEIDSIFVNAVATADVTGDGIDDVSYAHEYLAGWDNEIGVLNGTNGAVLWNLIQTDAGMDTLFSDIDDDGEIEAIYGVVKDNDDVEIQVRKGHNGTMEWSTIIGTGASGTNPDIYLFTHDVDKNGDDDLIVGNEFVDFHIRAYDGDDDTLMWTSEELNGYPRYMSFSDVNGNGNENIVAATYDRVQVLNAKDGTKDWYLAVAGTISGTAVGDFNDDGVDDVACSGGAEFSGDDPGKAVWAIKTIPNAPVLWEFDAEEYGNAVALGDFNGDEILDVIGVTSEDKAWAIDGPSGLLLWQWTSTANIYTVCTGDFNGDGFDDAAVAGNDDQVTALNGTDGSILWQFTNPAGQIYRKCLQSTDITGDGNIDVIVGSDDSFVYAIDGENGDFIWSLDLDGSVRDIDLYEVTGDSILDVLATASNEIVFINGADGSRVWDYNSGVSSAKNAVALDVNDDDILDVSWGSLYSLVMIDGATETELWSLSTTVNSDYCLASGDMNNDTIPDVIYGGGSTDQDIIALDGLNGDPIWDFPTGGDINCILTSNVDDDEELEVIAGSDDQYVYVIDANGSDQWSYSTADDLMHIAIGDITGDITKEIITITFGFDGVIYAFNSLSTYQALTADFSYEPTSPTTEDLIQFTDLSISNEGTIISWNWDFDDGNISTEANPTHTYAQTGDYTVTLTVTDDTDATDSISKTIHVFGVGEEVIDVNQTMFDRGFPIRHAADGDWAAAQNFTATQNTFTKAEIYLRKFGNPEFDLTVELRTDHPEGTLLDTLVFTTAEIPSSWYWLTLDFDDQAVTPETDLFIVCPPAPGGVTTSFGYEWGYAFGNQYDGGAFWFTRDGGALWRDLPTSYEFVFKTYGYN